MIERGEEPSTPPTMATTPPRSNGRKGPSSSAVSETPVTLTLGRGGGGGGGGDDSTDFYSAAAEFQRRGRAGVERRGGGPRPSPTRRSRNGPLLIGEDPPNASSEASSSGSGRKRWWWNREQQPQQEEEDSGVLLEGSAPRSSQPVEEQTDSVYTALHNSSPEREGKARTVPPHAAAAAFAGSRGARAAEAADEPASLDDGLPPPQIPSATVEDALAEGCSFFYRDVDADPGRRRRKRRLQPWRAVLRSGGGGHHDGGLFDYADAVTVTAPPVLQRYRTRYEQLNREIDLPEHHPSSDGAAPPPPPPQRMLQHDLQLTEQHSGISTAQSPQASTLLFYQADGRLLMRLPRDHVRLVMDPDLEAGVLSVEQRRRREDGAAAGGADAEGDLPPLRYVLTVRDDLYRKVVGDISSQQLTACGLGRCCHEDRKVDPRVALFIVVAVLLVLLVVTIVFGEK